MVVHEYYPKDFRVRRESEALVEEGYQVDVICLKGQFENFKDTWKGVRIHRLPVRRHRGSPLVVYLMEYSTFFFLTSFKLLCLNIRSKFDIIHVHNPPDFLVFVALIPKLFGTKVIFDVHDRVTLLYLSRFGLQENHPFMHFIASVERLAINFVDSLIVAVNVYKKMFIKIGIPERKIEVVLNTADEKYFYPRKSSNVEEDKKLKLFHHGTLVKRYGVDILIEAAGLLKKRGLDFCLEIYGEGDFRSHLDDSVKKLKLEKSVFLKGFLQLDYLPEKIAEADLCIVPNRKDTFLDTILPTKLLEYIVMEKPVIVSRTKGVLEFFSENEVTFFEPEDEKDLAEKIVSFIKNPIPFQDKILKAKKKYKDISWKKQSKILVKFYEQL